ncbi:MAG: hypothetical protein Q7V31_11950 [Parvibaculum sp.]|uniref:hypothetical protein n=1 Tax=Parvibaculum sp. TaxID=2024848 RepID=UPI0027180BCD|nr:hypothetical protein [Parvibaculum sp.]MDO8839631.1 hypothetical protein [Parvibaculum sp.]
MSAAYKSEITALRDARDLSASLHACVAVVGQYPLGCAVELLDDVPATARANIVILYRDGRSVLSPEFEVCCGL